GASVVNNASNSASLIPCGCSDDGCKRIRSTTLTTLTRSSGRCSRSTLAAASTSSVGTSPAQASTTSGPEPSLSVLAHSQIPAPLVQCSTAESMSSQSAIGCLPATITLM